MSHITFVVIVISKVGVNVGAVVPIIVVAGGNDAADSKSAVDVGVWTMLEGMSEGPTVGAARVGVISERESSAKRAVVPGP